VGPSDGNYSGQKGPLGSGRWAALHNRCVLRSGEREAEALVEASNLRTIARGAEFHPQSAPPPRLREHLLHQQRPDAGITQLGIDDELVDGADRAAVVEDDVLAVVAAGGAEAYVYFRKPS
jgi:hypothetical protein